VGLRPEPGESGTQSGAGRTARGHPGSRKPAAPTGRTSRKPRKAWAVRAVRRPAQADTRRSLPAQAAPATVTADRLLLRAP